MDVVPEPIALESLAGNDSIRASSSKASICSSRGGTRRELRLR